MTRLCVFIGLVLCIAAIASAQATTAPTDRPIYHGEPLKDVMKRVMQYQVEQYGNRFRRGWTAGAFWAGVGAAYETTGDEAFRSALKTWAEATRYRIGRHPLFADDIAVGQAYLVLYEREKQPWMLESLKASLDLHLSRETVSRTEVGNPTWTEPEMPFTGRNVWWWCDALFMAPPVLARYSAISGDRRYVELMHRMYWDTADYLFDQQDNLFFRDAAHFYDRKQSPNGKKIFWSRGNGWVYAGLIRVIDALPADDPHRARYIELFQKMTPAIVRYQQEDGLWRASLNDPQWIPEPESSGTAFFCYGLLAGINRGFLDREKYLPVALKAWRGLLANVNEQGRLGWAQNIGAAPATSTAENSRDYAQGAFLLAGSELYRAELSRVPADAN